MSHRPLISILLAFMGGIFLGYIALFHNRALIFPLLIIIASLLIAYIFIPRSFRSSTLLSLFFLTGILLVLNTSHQSDLLNLVHEKESIIIEGTVLQPTRIDEDVARVDVMTERLFRNGKAIPIKEKVYVTIYNHAGIFSPGERIRFPARLRPFKNFNNPGRYNYSLAMSLKGFSCGASVSDGRRVVLMGKGSLGLPLEIIERGRRPIRDFFIKTLSKQNQAILSALILGERQNIGPNIREPFNITGLGHILAVSGLHIGLIAWLSFEVFKWLFSFSHYWILKIDIRKAAAIMTCLPVIAYTFLAGFQVSSQRAMIMVLAFLFSIILGREKERWSTLALAAIMILSFDPLALFSISFLLSFMAVIGILWLAPAIHAYIPSPFKQIDQRTLWTPLYMYATGLTVITLSAVLFLLPITSFYFHRVPIVSIPANLTTVPILGFWILPFGLLSALFVHITPSVANLFLQLASWGLDWMMAIIQFWAQFQWAAFWVVTPNILEMILFYTLIFFIFFVRRRRWAKIGLCFILIAVFANISYWVYKTQFNPHLKVTYFDVGQGNAALIQFPGNQRMLVDGGGFRRGNFDVGRMVVAPALWHAKINRIDYLVLSHPQSDHMNGLRFIASHFKPREFWYNGDHVETPSFKELLDILEIKKIKKLGPTDLSETREISGVSISVLHPPISRKHISRYYNSQDLNNHSLVLKLSYKGNSILFTGDLEFSGEEKVITNIGPDLKSNIMLVPHHGSKRSCSKSFLRMVKPDLCIISSGSGNSFGFPHPTTMERLEQAGCRVIRIDKVGSIQMSIGEKGWEVDTFLDNEH